MLVTDSEDSRIGTSVSGFKLEKCIGEGGFGRVYLATHPTSGEQVAVKLLLNPNDTQLADRFVREWDALLRVEHPNVVKLLAFSRTNGECCAVFPLLRGETLWEAKDRGRIFSDGEIVAIARELARGLEAVHLANIVHRDLKPENVFLAMDGVGTERAVIIDLGIAVDLTLPRITPSPDQTAFGTPGYIAPERLSGTPATFLSDLWALGWIVFEMCCGIVSDSSTWFRKLPPTKPPEIQVALWEIIRRCCAEDPSDRIQSAREVLASLEKIHAEFHVDQSGNHGFRCIADALEAAREGDSILISKGRYQEALIVKKAVTIRATTRGDVVLVPFGTGDSPSPESEKRGRDDAVGLLLQATTTLDGLVIEGPSSSRDRMTLVASQGATVKIDHCVFRGTCPVVLLDLVSADNEIQKSSFLCNSTQTFGKLISSSLTSIGALVRGRCKFEDCTFNGLVVGVDVAFTDACALISCAFDLCSTGVSAHASKCEIRSGRFNSMGFAVEASNESIVRLEGVTIMEAAVAVTASKLAKCVLHQCLIDTCNVGILANTNAVVSVVDSRIVATKARSIHAFSGAHVLIESSQIAPSSGYASVVEWFRGGLPKDPLRIGSRWMAYNTTNVTFRSCFFRSTNLPTCVALERSELHLLGCTIEKLPTQATKFPAVQTPFREAMEPGVIVLKFGATGEVRGTDFLSVDGAEYDGTKVLLDEKSKLRFE